MIDKRKDAEQAKGRPKKEVNRGTKDEFETIALIVSEVSYIKEQVMRKLEAVGKYSVSEGLKPTPAPKTVEGGKAKK